MEVPFNVVGVNSGRGLLRRNKVITPQVLNGTINWHFTLSPTTYRPRSEWLYTNVKFIDRQIVDCKLAIMANTPGPWSIPHEVGGYNEMRLLWMHDTLIALRKYRTFCSKFAAQLRRKVARDSREGDFLLALQLGYL